MKLKFILPSLILLFSFTSISVYSQFQIGDKVLGAGLGFSSNKNKADYSFFPQTNTSTNSYFSAELGFVAKENRLNGIFAGGSYNVSKNEYSSQPSSNYKSDYFTIGTGYFTRRYRSIGKGFYIFGEGRAGINYTKQNKPATGIDQSKTYGINAGFYPGVAYKFNKRLLLEIRFADFVNIGYYHQDDFPVFRTYP